MNNVENTVEQFFKLIRQDPDRSTELLNSNNELAKLIWKGDEEFIVGSIPLHWASHDGNLELVEKLIEHAADVNSDLADWWCRPIDWAADSGQFEVVKYLIDMGATLGVEQLYPTPCCCPGRFYK